MSRKAAALQRERWTQEFLAEGPDGPVMRLNLTKRKAFLDVDAGEVSELNGVDVLRPWRRGDPRRPIGDGARLGYVDRPVVDAIGSTFQGLGASVFQAQYFNDEGNFLMVGTNELRIGTRLYPHLFGGTGWPVTMVGASFSKGYPSSIEHTYVSGFKTTTSSNDTLLLSPSLVAALASEQSFHVTSVLESDYRGILSSNGRKIHLFQGAQYATTAFLDVAEAQYGDRWRGVRISNSRVMMVSDRHAPRVVQLAGPRSMTPIRGINGASWNAGTIQITAVGQFTNYTFRAADRLVVTSGNNVYLGSFPISSKASNDAINMGSSLSSVNGTNIVAYIVRGVEQNNFNLAGPVPPFTLQIPQSGPSPNSNGPYAEITPSGALTKGVAAVRLRLIDLESNAASPFYQLGFLVAGTIKPGAAVLDGQGITISAASFAKLAWHRRAHMVEVWRKLSKGSDYFLELELPLAHVMHTGTNLTLPDDELAINRILLSAEVNRGVPPAGRDIAVLGDTGTVLIAGKTNKDDFINPIIDGLEYVWPTVDNDNVVHFSRTTAFDPENFPPAVSNQIVLSAIGDRFQRFAVSGNEVIAVMELGVYALASGGALGVRRKVISERGLGTPWPRSVISADRFAVWATTENVYSYDSSAVENFDNPLRPIGDEIRDWLLEASKNGDEIACAYDSRRAVLIVRRIRTDGTFEDWEKHLPSRQSAMMLDRPGVDVVHSSFADTSPSPTPLPYSVDSSGSVSEIGRRQVVGDTHPYDGTTVQANLDGTYTIAADKSHIQKAGVFSANCVGDCVRIRSADPARDGQRRTIIALENSGSAPTFANDGGPTQAMALEMLTPDLGVMVYRNNANVIHAVPVRLSGTGVISFGAPLVIAAAGGAGVSLSRESPTRCWMAAVIGGQVTVFMLNVFRDFIVGGLGVLVPSTVGTSTSPSIAKISTRKAVVGYKDSSNNRLRLVAAFANRDGTLSLGVHKELTGTLVNGKTYVTRVSDTAFFAAWHDTNGKISYLGISGSQITEVHTTTFEISAISDLAMVTQASPNNVNTVTLAWRLTAPASGKVGTFVFAVGSILALGTQTYISEAHDQLDVSMKTATQGLIFYRRTSDNALRVQPFTVQSNGGGGVAAIDAALTVTAHTNTTLLSASRMDDQHFAVLIQDSASSSTVTVRAGIVHGTGTVSVGAVGIAPTDYLPFSSPISGLAAPDEFIIGGVPFKIRFAPVMGNRMRNRKQLDGLSVWAAPDGRTVTTSKKLRARIYRNLGTVAEVLNSASATSVDVPVKAASEADATDEALFADICVDGKAIELELSNLDADTGLALNNVAAVITEAGDLTGDRSTSA